MGKNKLKKFADMEGFAHAIQPNLKELDKGFDLKGNWNKDFFKNDRPIILELGCGRGEYTVALSEKYPDKNFIGIDLKGSRMWNGAKKVLEKGLNNAAFLRVHIEEIVTYFGENEVDEIWITFPDPQIKYRRRKKRLTHPVFLEKYKQILKPEGIVHLKTDSAFLHGYTRGVLEILEHPIIDCTHNLYESRKDWELLEIKTYYENLFYSKGFPITYIQFQLNRD